MKPETKKRIGTIVKSVGTVVAISCIAKEISDLKDSVNKLDQKVGSLNMGYWKCFGRIRDLEMENETPNSLHTIRSQSPNVINLGKAGKKEDFSSKQGKTTKTPFDTDEYYV